jgi:hypothetical protein
MEGVEPTVNAAVRNRSFRAAAVVVASAVAISVTALSGGMMPALADPPAQPVTTTAPVITNDIQGPTNEFSGPTNEFPGPTNGFPGPTNEIPGPTDEIPPPETTTPATTTTTPVTTTTTRPTDTTERPVTTTTQRPVSTVTQRPVSTATQLPVTTSTTPVSDSSESTGGGGPALLLLLVLVCALLLPACLLVHVTRHRGVSWVQAHVTVAPRPGPGATFETRPGDEPNRDHVLSVVPVEVRRSTTVEENPL